MGNFFFSWLGAQTECYVCVCEGVYYVGALTTEIVFVT